MTIDVTPSATFSAQVAEEIRALMARRQIRQSQLARRIEVGEQWLSVRLRGKQPIDLNDLALIANGLGVNPADLIAGGWTGMPILRSGEAAGRNVSRPPNRGDSDARDSRRPVRLHRRAPR